MKSMRNDLLVLAAGKGEGTEGGRSRGEAAGGGRSQAGAAGSRLSSRREAEAGCSQGSCAKGRTCAEAGAKGNAPGAPG